MTTRLGLAGLTNSVSCEVNPEYCEETELNLAWFMLFRLWLIPLVLGPVWLGDPLLEDPAEEMEHMVLIITTPPTTQKEKKNVEKAL